MPFPVPTLDDTRVLAQNDMAAIPGIDPRLRRRTTRVLADMSAGFADGEYQYLTWQSQQYLADSAESDYLYRIGAIYGLTPNAALPSAGTAAFSGQANLPIPAGTQLATSDQSVIVATQALLTLDSTGNGTVAVESVSGGSDTDLDAGTALTMQVAIAGVLPTATVVADASGDGLTGGLDQESDAAFRIRVLARIQQPPQGGAASDYWQWAKAVAAVTRAWVYPLNRGAGTVDVAFVCDGRTNIIPLSADITAVQAAINAVRPVTADCQVFAPIPDAIAVTIASLVPSAGTTIAAVQANARAALATLFAQTTPGGATYGDGILPGGTGGTLYLEAVYAAIASAAGVASFDLVAPAADIVSLHGHLSTLGTVSFQ